MNFLKEFESAHPDEPVPDVTWGAMTELGLTQLQQDALYKAVVSALLSERRERVMKAENEYAAARNVATAEQPHTLVDLTAARKALIAEQFYNGSRWVPWVDSTVADHEAAIAEIQSHQVDPALKTQELHRQAIADMLAAGVERFGDLS